MKLQVKQVASAQELTVGSQKEFLQLWNSGVITGDDLVLRGEKWVPAAELPWIAGMRREARSDNRRLLWITLVLMLAGLAGVLYVQSHASALVKRTGALPPGAVHAVPKP
ncbi:MAG TPA: hypothetical protein VLW85_12945 [Myxococcales bacterium]|nr:hypothetical protein [Myxococcales bacterium]